MERNFIKSSNKDFYDEGLYFWSASAKWKKTENELLIEMFSYTEEIGELFPKFYYETQDGITIYDLMDKFKEIDEKKFKSFLKDLIKNRILVNTLLSPQELFYTQNNIIPSKYTEDTFIDPNLYESFKNEQLSRSVKNVLSTSIKLEDIEFPNVITERETYRKFDEKNKITFSNFSYLISVFKQYSRDEKIRYNYATDGGLYPIDIYMYIKDNRVENVKGGLYYYNPIKNEIELVSESCVITKEAQYSSNKPIFESSAFTIFLIYNGSVTLPKYGGMGYFYSAIDSGIMVQLLTQVGELNNIGICSIGDMNFNKIKKYFKLSNSQVMLHSIEVGLKTN